VGSETLGVLGVLPSGWPGSTGLAAVLGHDVRVGAPRTSSDVAHLFGDSCSERPVLQYWCEQSRCRAVVRVRGWGFTAIAAPEPRDTWR
jgi:hypothetical protein